MDTTHPLNKVGCENKYYYLAFNHFQKIGPVTMKKLEKYFLNIHQAFLANNRELERAGLTPCLASEFSSWRNSPAASIDKMLKTLEKENINFMTWNDTEYPRLLKEIYDPPYILYYKGRLKHKKGFLAVVGSRQNSRYGKEIITELLPPVIKAEIIIVSGLALGIDALAHQKALDFKGTTWAVLGSGLDLKNIYPEANRCLAQKIIDRGGALLSEFPPGTPPYKQNFPQRNRIIAGLASATLVVEAKDKSGALITARQALEENREVLTVPGNIFSELSSGPNALIKAGAKAISAAADILETYSL